MIFRFETKLKDEFFLIVNTRTLHFDTCTLHFDTRTFRALYTQTSNSNKFVTCSIFNSWFNKYSLINFMFYIHTNFMFYTFRLRSLYRHILCFIQTHFVLYTNIFPKKSVFIAFDKSKCFHHIYSICCFEFCWRSRTI